MKNLMLLRDKILGFTSPAKIPVTFSFDGIKEKGIDSDKKPSVRSFVADSAVRVTEITAVASKGMILNVRETLYSDFPVVEWGAEMTSFAKTESERLSDFGISKIRDEKLRTDVQFLKAPVPVLFREAATQEMTEFSSVSPKEKSRKK